VLGPASSSFVSVVSRLLSPSIASAAEDDTEVNVRALVERYRQALQSKEVDAVARLSVSFSQRQRDALQAYFDNARDLQIEVTDVVVMTHDEEMTVSFTRRDRFTDRESEKPV